MKILNFFLNFIVQENVYAHCDIPCGIYDPHYLQLSAHSVLRMVDLIEEAQKESDKEKDKKQFIHDITRLTKVKEEHAEIFKNELRILWGDYFKDEHLQKYPELHQKVFEAMKLASKVRKDVDRKSAEKLVAASQEISEIFFETKNFATQRVPSLYPTQGVIIVQKG